MTDSIIEILDVECSRQQCTCMYDSMYRCGKNSCHATFSPATFLPDVLRFFIWRTLTNNHSIAPWIIRHLFHTVSEIACSNHRAHIDAKLGHYFKCVRYEEMRKRLVHLDNDMQKWERDLFTLTMICRNEETCSHWQWYAEMRRRLVHLDSDTQKWERLGPVGHFAVSHMEKVPFYNPQVLQNVVSWGSVGPEKMVCEQNFMLWCWKVIEEGKAFCYMQWHGLVCYIKKGECLLCAAALRHHP